MKEMIIDVAVATLWTSYDSPRQIDRPALQNPVRLSDWLNGLTMKERLALSEQNLVQSQVLYGEKVYIVEEQGRWAEVIIPGQPSSKDDRGYPGWIPLNQLTHPLSEKADTFAVVTAPKTNLYKTKKEIGIEISYQTRLPVISESGEWVEVLTPSGNQFVRGDDVRINQSKEEISTGSGGGIVQAGKQFLGLLYLWGGMSGFGYDCSGFAYNMHRAQGLIIPRDAHDQARSGEKVDQGSPEPGDLLFFAYEEGKGRVHHVGICYGEDKLIHAPKTGKTVEVISLPGSAYETEYCGARRYWK